MTANAIPLEQLDTDALEDSIYRKVSWRIVPLFICCFLFAYLDRVNISFAKLQMASDLGFSETVYGLGASLFFVGYFLFEVPSNVLLKKLKPSRWIAFLMFGWGACTIGLGGAQNYATVTAVRFLLGMFEAGLFPGLVFYLTFWYRASERSMRVAVILASATLAGAFGGAIAYGVGHMKMVQGLAAWRW